MNISLDYFKEFYTDENTEISFTDSGLSFRKKTSEKDYIAMYFQNDDDEFKGHITLNDETGTDIDNAQELERFIKTLILKDIRRRDG